MLFRSECLTIEFYAMVYFSIYPIHQINENGPDFEVFKKEMVSFKEYMDSKKNELGSVPEFISFNSLPQIKNPQVNSS